MPGVFDVLGHDQDEVKCMLSELQTGPTAATGAGGNALTLRKKIVEHGALADFFLKAQADSRKGAELGKQMLRKRLSA
jgi:hypothetical protein